MLFSSRERIGLFIDGPNFNASCRSLDIDVDFKRLLDFFRERTQLVRAHYYAVVTTVEDASSIRPLLDWLEYNGFTTVTKQQKPLSGTYIDRHGVEVALAVDALRLSGSLDHLVVFSGNGELTTLVGALKEVGKRVTVVSTLMSQPPMIADELRRKADQFIDLVDLKALVQRQERKPRGS